MIARIGHSLPVLGPALMILGIVAATGFLLLAPFLPGWRQNPAFVVRFIPWLVAVGLAVWFLVAKDRGKRD